MKIEIAIAIMSHLSDAQELLNVNMSGAANTHIDFAKMLLLKYRDNLNQARGDDEELTKMWNELVNGRIE